MFKHIIEKYELASNSYSPFEDDYKHAAALQLALFERWLPYIQEGYYGFDMGGCPISWYFAIEEALCVILDKCPQMRILQIKLKFGGLRMYIEADDWEIQEAIDELEKVCYDDSLVY